jgi:hypothetical protein
MKRTFGALALALAAALPAQASLVTTYDSMTGKPWETAGLYGGYFAPFDSTSLVGQRFTAQASGYIAELTLSAFGMTSFTVDLHADDGGHLGAKLATLAMSGSQDWGHAASGSFDSGYGLDAGNSYWLVIGAGLGEKTESWYYMDAPAPAGNALFNGQAAGHQIPTSLSYYDNTTAALGAVVGLQVSAVPEPSGLALSVAGLAGVMLARRRVSSPSTAT